MLSAPLKAAFWMLGVMGAALGLTLFPLMSLDGQPPLAAVVIMAVPFIFWAYLAAGLVAWRRRPYNGLGLLLVWAGLGVWLLGLEVASVPALHWASNLFPFLYAALIHLLLAFPAGRLNSSLERALAIGMYIVMVGLTGPRYLIGPTPQSSGWEYISPLSIAQAVIGHLLTLAVALVLIRRLLRAEPRQRRSLGIVYGYGMFSIVSMSLVTSIVEIGWPEQDVLNGAIQVTLLALMPGVILAAFLRGGFQHTAELEKLSAWLSEADASRLPIQDALANALGDPTLTVAYWSSELREWVNAQGHTVAPDAGRDARANHARHEIHLGGTPVAVIAYDATLLRDSPEVAQAASLAAIALERERLAAALRSSRQVVIESRKRLFGAADAERRRIGRDLHDGLQARLVLLGVQAQRIATAPAESVAGRATALRDHIDQAADELRAIVHDLAPPALVELGIVGAVEELVQAMPIPTRLDAAVPQRVGGIAETTAYLVVAEALTNVVKHSGATQCTVSLRRDGTHLHIAVTDNGHGQLDAQRATTGTGLTSIADRVAATGGTSGIEPQSQGGTALWARIPYGQ
jgi:signal transduction histidine kinase